MSNQVMNKPEKIDPRLEKEEKLREIGGFIQSARREQNISLEIIAEKTRIRKRLIQAIETGNLAELPEDVYIRAFIKEIANYLGLRGDELASQFPIYTNFRQPKRYFWIPLPSFQLRPIHLYFFYILLVMVSVRAIADLVQPDNSLQVISIETNSQPKTKPITPPKSVSPPQSVVNKPTPEKPQSVSVEIKVEDKSWLKVVVDGKTEFEGMVTKGTQKSWVANQQLTIRAGNAGAVLVAYNQQEAKQLGKPGQVQEVTYTTNKKKEPSS
jgi:cytoskeletal protein RodZ